jgi:ABC-type glycerol-3-phosphate transport system substrate-binding protein
MIWRKALSTSRLKNNPKLCFKMDIKNIHICVYPKIIIIVLAMFFVLSCSNSKENSLNYKPMSVVEQTATVNFIGHWMNEGEREMFVRNLARVYEFENQHVDINLKFPEEVYYDHSDRTSNERYVAKVYEENITDWDILRVNSEFREVYTLTGDYNWAKKTLVDFSEMDEFREGTIPDLLTQESLDEWNGIIPGPYIEGQYWALWANQRVAEKIGIEVKQFGMTFDDFASYLEALHVYNQNNPEDAIIPVYESYVWETTEAIAIMLYSSLLDDSDEFLLGEITPKRLSAWEKTLQAMEQISQYQPLHPSWRETSWSDTHNMMLDGECLFYVNGSWMYNIWKGIDSEKVWDIIPCEFPAFEQLTIYPAAYQIPWGVHKNAPNKEEAVKFLLAMNTPAVAEMWSRYTKCPTGVKGNLASASLGGDQFEVFAQHIQDQYGTHRFRYHESGFWILNDQHAETNTYFKEVIQGEMTANEAMEAINRSIQMYGFSPFFY